jgi:predicted lipoprotein with Yx(FWY)xxD motif
MTWTRSPASFAGLVALPLAAVALAGCGGSSTASVSAALPKTASGRPATIGLAKTGLGTMLVNSKGRSVYVFQKDSGTKSACFGACATNWPPVRASGIPTVGSGLKSSLVAVSKRSDGSSQVTYDGHPLYLFAGDHSAGSTSGQRVNAFGGAWYALSPAGTAITSSPSSSGGGYGY